MTIREVYDKYLIVIRIKRGCCKFCGELQVGFVNGILIPQRSTIVYLCDECTRRFRDAIVLSPSNEETIVNSIIHNNREKEIK